MNANGDDNNPLYRRRDDEDGAVVVDLSSDKLKKLWLVDIRVLATNTTGQVATLCGFFDLNRDGDFLDAGENASAVVTTGTTGGEFTLVFGSLPDLPIPRVMGYVCSLPAAEWHGRVLAGRHRAERRS